MASLSDILAEENATAGGGDGSRPTLDEVIASDEKMSAEEALEAKLAKLEATKKELAEKTAKETQATLLLRRYVPFLALGPLVPSLFAFFTVTYGSVVLNTASTECVVPLRVFLVGIIVYSYIFLFVYGWIWIGPYPVKRYRVLWIIMCSLLAVGTIWMIIGTVWFSMADPCIDTSPTLYSFTQLSVTMYWTSMCVLGVYVAAQLFHWGQARAKKKKAEALEKAAQQEEEEAAAAAKREAAEAAAAERLEEEERIAEEQRKRDEFYGASDDDGDAEDAGNANSSGGGRYVPPPPS